MEPGAFGSSLLHSDCRCSRTRSSLRHHMMANVTDHSPGLSCRQVELCVDGEQVWVTALLTTALTCRNSNTLHVCVLWKCSVYLFLALCGSTTSSNGSQNNSIYVYILLDNDVMWLWREIAPPCGLLEVESGYHKSKTCSSSMYRINSHLLVMLHVAAEYPSTRPPLPNMTEAVVAFGLGYCKKKHGGLRREDPLQM